MTDRSARARMGLAPSAKGGAYDPRVRIDLAHLRSFEGAARSLSFLPRQPARSVLNGRHASRIRGRGLNFEELRGYLPGDDVRSIDWRVTARTGEPHVRVFTEERDRPALIVVDQRMSMFFGSRLNMKSVTAAEAAALAAFRIGDQGDRVGGILFGDEGVVEVRPERARRALERFLAALAAANQTLDPSSGTTPVALNRIIEAVARVARRAHLILIFSDFDGLDERTKTLLGTLARHNDVLLGLVTDPLAEGLQEGLKLVASDGILQADIDSDNVEQRRALSAFATGRVAEIERFARTNGIPLVPLSAGEETLPQFRRLFGLR